MKDTAYLKDNFKLGNGIGTLLGDSHRALQLYCPWVLNSKETTAIISFWKGILVRTGPREQDRDRWLRILQKKKLPPSLPWYGGCLPLIHLLFFKYLAAMT